MNGELSPIINFIWNVADDVLRDVFVRSKYRDVILPMTVLRRLDCVLEPTKYQVLKTYNEYRDKIDDLSGLLTSKKHGSGHVFYNYSPFTMKNLLDDPKNIRSNFEDYLNGFSNNVQDIISKFELRNQINKIDNAGLIFPLIEKFCSNQINLGPKDVLDKDGKVVHKALSNLGMGYVFEELIRRFNEENSEEAGQHFTPREIIKLMTHLVFLPVKDKIKNGTYLVYDPASGSGGMLTESKKFILDKEGKIKSEATIHLYGQEVNPEIYAICKADMMIKEEDPDKIIYGSSLSKDGFPNLTFDFMLTNPPYGRTWKTDFEVLAIGKKKEIIDPRFKVGVPRVNDGQLLFLSNMLSKMKDTELGSRIASVHNGSALFTGDAGQGESEIRRYIIENDWLECIIGLPKDMFYNTGISTYIWVLSNRKPPRRKGKIQLIDASSEHFFTKMLKPLGAKRNEMLDKHIQIIAELYHKFEQNEYSMIFDNDDFGYHQITVERPLRDENGNIIKDIKGKPKPDSNLRDYENIPLKQDIQAYFEKEVLPYMPDAWIDHSKNKIGYDISFTKYFYKYQPLRPLSEISKDILSLEKETEGLLKDIIEQ